jgi:4a-hydroxytetrahydrobiopterin dehydratase
MKPAALNEAQIIVLLAALPHWRRAGTSIERDFIFANFSEAWGFMNRVALLAEKHDHHPDWSNAYKQVHIALSTHDAGGLTTKDRALAEAIDRLVEK